MGRRVVLGAVGACVAVVVGASGPVQAAQDPVPASCSRTVTPSCLRALYGVPAGRQARPVSVTVAASVVPDSLDRDVAGFMEKFSPEPQPAPKVAKVSRVGAKAGDEGVEGHLAAEYILALTPSAELDVLGAPDDSGAWLEQAVQEPAGPWGQGNHRFRSRRRSRG